MSWVVKVGGKYWAHHFACAGCGVSYSALVHPPRGQRVAERFADRTSAALWADRVDGARVVKLVRKR